MNTDKIKNFLNRNLILICCCLSAVAFIVAGTILFYQEAAKDKEEPRTENTIHGIADGETKELTSSKQQAYSTDQEDDMDLHRDTSNVTSYWDRCGREMELEAQGKRETSSAGQGVSTEELLGLNNERQQVSSGQAAPRNPYRETPEEREARHQRRQEEAIELAERFQENSSSEDEEEDSFLEQDPQVAQVPQTEVRRSGSISSLDQHWDDSGGLSSLNEEQNEVTEDPDTPFKCMFARNSKITDGQRVTVILLEDLMVSGISVPRNTHLMATCQISSRLELEFNNIEIGGRILSLGYEAYDIDGSKGIYCPDVSQTGRTVRNRGTDIISSSLSGKLGRVAREVTSTGISLIQSSDGQRTVTVPAGYTFFIVKKKIN